MSKPRPPHIRLVTEYGHTIAPAPGSNVALPSPDTAAYGRESDYIPYEVAGSLEEPVHAVALLTWPAPTLYKVWLAPYTEMTLSEIDAAGTLTYRGHDYAVNIQGTNLTDYTFLDAFVKFRVKSIRQWNPALHKRPNAEKLCITKISVERSQAPSGPGAKVGRGP